MLEKIAYNQMQEYLDGNSILDPFRTGFRPFHSTETALLKPTDDIRLCIDKKLVTLLLLFDFSKTFERITSTRLHDHLRLMGLSRTALLWIDSYFTNRMQAIITPDNSCSCIITDLGFPQGSVLGPLLFCLYINALHLLSSSMPYTQMICKSTSRSPTIVWMRV